MPKQNNGRSSKKGVIRIRISPRELTTCISPGGRNVFCDVICISFTYAKKTVFITNYVGNLINRNKYYKVNNKNRSRKIIFFFWCISNNIRIGQGISTLPRVPSHDSGHQNHMTSVEIARNQ